MSKQQAKGTKSGKFEPIPSDTGLWQCLSSMRQTGLDALPVCEGEQLVGLVVEEDVLRALRVGESGHHSFVRDIMKTRVFCCYEDQNPKKVMGDMEESGVRHAFILNRTGSLIGMISLGEKPKAEKRASGWLC